MPEIKRNLVSVDLLSKARVKLVFESDKVALIHTEVFVGKGYCRYGLFVLMLNLIRVHLLFLLMLLNL